MVTKLTLQTVQSRKSSITQRVGERSVFTSVKLALGLAVTRVSISGTTPVANRER